MKSGVGWNILYEATHHFRGLQLSVEVSVLKGAETLFMKELKRQLKSWCNKADNWKKTVELLTETHQLKWSKDLKWHSKSKYIWQSKWVWRFSCFHSMKEFQLTCWCWKKMNTVWSASREKMNIVEVRAERRLIQLQLKYSDELCLEVKGLMTSWKELKHPSVCLLTQVLSPSIWRSMTVRKFSVSTVSQVAEDRLSWR